MSGNYYIIDLLCTRTIPNQAFPINIQVRTLHSGIGVMHNRPCCTFYLYLGPSDPDGW